MEMDDPNKNTKQLRKDVKRAKLFAIQHLTRRIKMLKNKRGTEQQVEKNSRKATRFDEELEYIKELDIDVVIRNIQTNECNDYSTMVGCEDIEKRATARLILSKPIQDYLKPTTSANNSRQKHKLKTPKDISSDSPMSSNQPSATKQTKPKSKQKHEIGSTNLCSDSPSLSDYSSDHDCFDSEDGPTLEKTPASYFVERLSSSSKKEREHDTTRKNRNNVKQNDEKTKNKSRNEKERKKSSNRMGQRARQRLWKEKYGRKAKHIKSSENVTKPEDNRRKKHKKEMANMNQRQEDNTKQDAKGKDNAVEERTTSHPSWEASKRRKLEQNISQTTFQGKKITFEDSE